MVEKNLTFLEAANYVRKCRPIIFPNFGFQRQLYELEQLLKEEELAIQKEKSSIKGTISRAKMTKNSSMNSTMRKSMRAKSSNRINNDKHHNKGLTYKEKAKHYYLGMQKNNKWTDEEGSKVAENYDSHPIKRKSHTAKPSGKALDKNNPRINIKMSQKEQDEMSVKALSQYKRINRKYYKSKTREEKPRDIKHVKHLSPKSGVQNTNNMIYQEVKSYYELTNDHKRSSKSAMRKSSYAKNDQISIAQPMNNIFYRSILY